MIERLRELVPKMSIRRLCSLLNINRQWYYHHRRSGKAEDRDYLLTQALRELRKDFAGYGYRRMTKALQRAGWHINHKRVERVMKQEGLTCKRKPRFVHTTDSKHSEPVYTNLLKELSIKELNQCWVADLTYVYPCTSLIQHFQTHVSAPLFHLSSHLSAATSQGVSVFVQCILRALLLGSHRLGNKEWFVQTPQYRFKNTFWHSILLVVLSLERCLLDSTRFHTEWCVSNA